MNAVAERVVTAGMALLEQKIPGFWREDHEPVIDLARLNMHDCSACVVGQLHPGTEYENEYLNGLKALGVGADDEMALGFEASLDVSYAELTAEFRRQITARRAEARAATEAAS